MKKLFLLFVAVYAVASSYNNKMLDKISKTKATKSFAFAVMGDNRDGEYVLKKIIAHMNQNSSIQFALNNGDLVPDGYKKEFTGYVKTIQTSNKPILSVIGNHELPWYGGESNYEKIFGQTYFSFIFGNSYFIILDDSDEKGVFEKQYSWLDKELKKSQSYQNRFVFMHVPLYDPRKGAYQKGHSLKKIQNAKKLNDLFDRYGVTMLFCSHIHSYFRGFWHKTPYIITGGAGAPLKKEGFYHYVKVAVSGNTINYKVVKVDAEPLGIMGEIMQSVKDVLSLH